jgi:hypothetical protein
MIQQTAKQAKQNKQQQIKIKRRETHRKDKSMVDKVIERLYGKSL